MDGTALLILLARAASILLAACAGYGIGRTVPGWQMDRFNEGSRFRNYGWGPRSGDSLLPGACMIGSGPATGLSLAGAAALWVFFWPHNNEFPFAEPGLWVLLLTLGVGYIYSVLTDKGPVGPLE